jgi:Glycosyltransferase family 87
VDLKKPASIKLLQVSALLAAFGLMALVSIRWRSYQWDFHMFYGSATDFLQGTNPYRGKGLSFYHPPLTLYLYGLFAQLPLALAYELWLALKIAALGALFLIWNRNFLKLDFAWLTVLYFILAYNGAIYSDLVSGNVSLFEQFGLWAGFAALLQGRYALFSLCVILVAQFKLTPIFFSVLLLLAPKRPQGQWFAICIVGFVAVFLLNLLLQPALLKDFFTVAAALDERGAQSPGALAFVRDILDRIGGPKFSLGTGADEAIFIIVALAIGLFSLAVVVWHRSANAEPDSKLIVYFACLAYALAVPRMKSYSYILLLIPTLALIRLLPRRTLVPAASAALAALVVFPLGSSLLPFRSLSQLLYEYMSLAAAFAGWVGILWVLQRKDAANAERAPPTDRQLA